MTSNISHTITAPAKINLALRIVQKRKDGYHDLESLVAFADLCDVLNFGIAAKDSITITGEFAPVTPDGAENLVLRAIQQLRAITPTLPHFQINLQKNLPVGGGIGGGSADAAATIRFIREYFASLFPSDFDWLDFAKRIGADVPVCLASRPCLMRGIGEQIELLPGFPKTPGILIFPNISITTKDVFAARSGSSHGKPISADNFNLTIANQNDLFGAAAQIHPAIADIAGKLSHIGAMGYGMSGSGSCFYVLAENASKQVALLERIKNIFPQFWVKRIIIAA